MFWLLSIPLQIYFILSGIRHEEQAGLWNWSKFLFALGFAALDFSILMLPIYALNPHGRYYGLFVVAAWIIAALNFIWFILVCRRWSLPDGRTSLQANRDEHQDH
jgi:hypothetical protein